MNKNIPYFVMTSVVVLFAIVGFVTANFELTGNITSGGVVCDSTGCIGDVNVSDVWVNESGDTMTGLLTHVGLYTDQTVWSTGVEASQIDFSTSGGAAGTMKAVYMDLDLTATAGNTWFGTMYPIDIDIDFVDSGSIYSAPVITPIKIDITSATATSNANVHLMDLDTDAIHDASVNIVATGTGSAASGFLKLVVTSSDVSANLVATRTASSITDTSNNKDAIGYQGYAANSDAGGNGRAIGLNPIIYGSANTKYNVGLQPFSISSSQTKDKVFVVHNAAFGHLLMDRGGVVITSSAQETLTSAPGSHITDYTGSNGDGSLYVENDVEVDGVLYVDGNISGNTYYSESWFHNHTGVALNFAVADVWYNLTFTNHTFNGFDNISNTHITCEKEGLYLVNFQAVGDGQNNHRYILSVGLNDNDQDNLDVHKKMSAGGDIVTLTGNGFLRLALEDNVSLIIQDDGGTGSGTYYASNLNLVRIGN